MSQSAPAGAQRGGPRRRASSCVPPPSPTAGLRCFFDMARASPGVAFLKDRMREGYPYRGEAVAQMYLTQGRVIRRILRHLHLHEWE